MMGPSGRDVTVLACLLAASSLLLLTMNSNGVEAKPRAQRNHQRRGNYRSFFPSLPSSSSSNIRHALDGSDGEVAPFSASSYHSLGIQPSARSLGHASSQYWWQGPESPFKEGAGQNQGIQSGAKRPGQTVVGCSGDGCGGSFGVSASASSFSSSNNGGGSCCNLYWQKPNHPCSTHQGPDCPSGFSCVNYRSCSNGVISPFNSGYGNSGKPSLRELMEYGRPCGYSGTEVCCQSPPPQQPSVQEIVPPPTQPPYVPPVTTKAPIYYPPPPTQPVYVPPPSSTQAPIYYPPPPPPTQAVVIPPSTTKPPVYYPPPTQPPTTTKAPVYYPPPSPAPPAPTSAPAIYYPPATKPVITTQPPPITAPAPTKPVTQAVVAPVGPPAPAVPYPGCAAALKCVPEEYCNIEGVMVNTPVFYTQQQKEFRTPLMACLNVETNQVGYCCRDPLYNDPWPADMPMPNMPAKPPVAPVVVQPTPPPYVQCTWNQECVPAHVCSSQSGQFNAQPGAQCQSSITGQPGVCCNRPTTTPAPPPRPTAPVVAPPPVDYLPPPPPPVEYLPPPPTQAVLAPPEPTPPTITFRPPTTTTTPPPPPPPPTQPVVIDPPPAIYLPPVQPPAPKPPTSPVVLPPVDYLPPPPPTSASQVSGSQCGSSKSIPKQMVARGEAALGEFPWHAMIAQQNGSMSCSGALIDSKFVVTAFHCVQGVNPTTLRVRLGEQRVGITDEPLPHYEIPVSAVVGHPDFAEGSLFNDVALLMLSTPAPSGLDHIAPICLPSQQEQPSSQCIVTGWGHDTLSGLHTGMLNKVAVNLVRNPDCQTSLQSTHLGKYFKLHKSFTCASTQDSINPCKVDGGSPMACQRPDGSYVLAGLSSWSVGCSNQQQPSVFVDVPPVAPWIQQQMNQPEASLVDTSNAAFHNQQQFQENFGPGAGYGR